MSGPKSRSRTVQEEPDDTPHVDDCPASEDPERSCRCAELRREANSDAELERYESGRKEFE